MAGAVSSITVALVRPGVSGDVVREVDRGRTRPDTIDFYWLALIDNSRTKYRSVVGRGLLILHCFDLETRVTIVY